MFKLKLRFHLCVAQSSTRFADGENKIYIGPLIAFAFVVHNRIAHNCNLSFNITISIIVVLIYISIYITYIYTHTKKVYLPQDLNVQPLNDLQ